MADASTRNFSAEKYPYSFLYIANGFMDIKNLPKKDWPSALLELPDPPKKLFLLGDMPDKDLTYLCVVGSRKFTSYGRQACEKLIRGLAGYPVVIVSGFCLGIDTIAHKTAMEVGLKTLAFPGSGLSKKAIHPKTNLPLIDKILKSGNSFLSEFEPDFKATHWTFPMRNRLMAGISKAVLIVEGEEKSGTMITARLAMEYNRDVLVIPGSIFSPSSRGTNNLIRQGATPITSLEDLLEALGLKVDSSAKQQNLFADLSEEEKQVLEILREPLPRDELIRELGIPISQANALISTMEIKGLLKEELGELRRN